MTLNDHAELQVAVKAILRRDSKILCLETQDGYIDFPGGRMDKSEIEIPLEEVLRREIEEELGPTLKYKINKLAFVAKRQYDFKGITNHIIAIYYDVSYVSGEILLSEEHAKKQWVAPAELLENASKFVSADEFEQFNNYFS